MGRIDEALRQVAKDERAEVPESNIAAADVFASPWSFPADRTADEPRLHADASEATSEVTDLAHASGRLALFRGFDSQLTGRIVASPEAPPLLTEQFRRLAATLHHAQLVQGTKVVMVSSANAGDGKTLTSTNLALTLSESYRREVLLIDADLRRPSLHEVFRVPNVAGLNDGLKARSEDKLSVLKITETLTLLPAGRPDPDPMSSLTSPRMGEILREGASRFDWVILDTAPLGLLADANLLSTMIDGALIVIRAGHTPYAAVAKAIESLGRDRILGAVLNAVEASSEDYTYYTRYGHADPPTRP